MYTDILTQIKNAQAVKKAKLKVPFSNMNLAILATMERAGFLSGVSKKGRMPKRVLEIELKYDAKGEGAIHGVRFNSKPSRRLYAGYREFRPVRQGYGAAIVSSSQGIMTAQEAKRKKVGGQLLFEIW
ncbi:MAG: 30S ribosomal protein S8 [Candidatus Harrisonbacteria bacterium]|nr:30S ribosomal protein S8 [Candidatus Harrisonbacteria bacterium]